MREYSQTIEALYERFTRFRTANITAIDSVPESGRDVIPHGLRNNIYWQAGHIVTVQASLLYRRCGVEPPLGEIWFASFGKATSPEDFTSKTPSFAEVREQLTAMIERTRTDLPKLADLKYVEPITVTGSETLHTFIEALNFLSMHEVLHLGSINSMRRLLGVE